MVEALGRLVDCESPSNDPVATEACAAVADDITFELLGQRAERVMQDGRTHLRWAFGARKDVVLVGHLDTVWPLGTVARWPFEVKDDVATGPGAFDMKAGVVQLLFALHALEDLDGVTVLLTTDEEIGAPSSRELIEETASGAKAALVLEPSLDSALKTERKGHAVYRVDVVGRAAHAGLDPDKGVNAAIELAHQVLAIAEIARPELGTTVSPNVMTAGTATNTIPGRASLQADVRAASVEEQKRVYNEIQSLTPVLSGTSLEIRDIASCPPMPRSASAELFSLAQRLAGDLGLSPLEQKAAGGASDGNFIAGIGIPVLDGLGAVGDGAHAEGEHVVISKMPERAALVAALVKELTN